MEKNKLVVETIELTADDCLLPNAKWVNGNLVELPLGSGYSHVYLGHKSIVLAEEMPNGQPHYKRVTEAYRVRVKGEITRNSVINAADVEDELPVALMYDVAYGLKTKMEALKELTIRDIRDYDRSHLVNEFFVTKGGEKYTLWFSKEERVAMRNGVQAWREAHDMYPLNIVREGVILRVECNKLLESLQLIERYAVECRTRTTELIDCVKKATDYEKLKAMRFSGYPQKLTIAL